MDEYGRWSWNAVVVRAHRSVVGTGGKHGDDISACGAWKREVFEQDIARLTMFADEIHGFIRFGQRTISNTAGVERLISNRPWVVTHAAINGHVGANAGNRFS